jgi:hypothetical protein
MDNLKRTLTGVFETPKKATLVGPKGERVAVEINSPQAKSYFSKGYTLEEKPPVNPGTVTSGSVSPGSSPMLPQGSVSTTNSPQDTMMSSYNSLMMDSLKKAQGVDTTELLKRQRELQRKAISARTADAPEGYETMSPSQQNQIRNSNASVIEKELDDNAYQLARAEKAISNFEDVFYKAQQFGQDFAEKMVLPESMIENYKLAIEANPDNMTVILSTLNDKSKQAVLNSLDYAKLQQPSELDTYRAKKQIDSEYDAGTDTGTSDYKNWVLAGGQAGTGKTFAQWLTKNDGGRPLTPGQTNLISEGKQLQLVLNPLYQTLENNKNAFGPVAGFLGSKNPYNTNSQTIDAEMRRASQTIGKYMEGGVLRKEDEEKYRKMLPQLTDTPDVAKNKLDGVKSLLEGKIKSYLNDYAAGGFDVSAFNAGSTLNQNKKYNSLIDLKNSDPTGFQQLVPIIEAENLSEEEALRLYEISFNNVGGDTKLATAVASIPDGQNGGQCGRFVNSISGLGVGDSYQSKMAKMDKSIQYPEPGMIFTMPYKDTGHTGIIIGISGKNAIVKDSNYSLDEKIKTHTIPLAKMTGFARIS